MNAISKLAFVFLVVGAVILWGPVFGFSTFAADRGMNVGTAASQNALLGINATDQTVQVAGNDDSPQKIGIISNNLDQVATVSVEVVHIPNGSDGILQAQPAATNVDPGASTDATVECAEGTTLGVEDVRFRAEAEGSSVQITNATFTATIDIQCGKGSGQISPTNSGLSGVFASNLTNGNSSQPQTIEFDLTTDLPSNETVTITLRDVQKNNRLDYTGTTIETDSAGSVSGQTVGNHDYEIVFDPTETIARGETVTINVGRVDASGSQAAKSAPYDAVFQRSDKPDSESDTFDVN